MDFLGKSEPVNLVSIWRELLAPNLGMLNGVAGMVCRLRSVDCGGLPPEERLRLESGV